MSDENALVPASASALVDMAANDLLKSMGINLEANAEVAADAAARNSGGGGDYGARYDTRGRKVVRIGKGGFFEPVNDADQSPFKSMVGVIVQYATGLVRWPTKAEAAASGLETPKPLCKSVGFTLAEGKEHPLANTGLVPNPALSAYHAARMYPTLRGNGGHDGKQGVVNCIDCPMAVKLSKEEKEARGDDAPRCGVNGYLEVIVSHINDEQLKDENGRPTYEVYVIENVPVASATEYTRYLEATAKANNVRQEQVHTMVLSKLWCTKEQNPRDKKATFGKLNLSMVQNLTLKWGKDFGKNMNNLFVVAYTKVEAAKRELEEAQEDKALPPPGKSSNSVDLDELPI